MAPPFVFDLKQRWGLLLGFLLVLLGKLFYGFFKAITERFLCSLTSMDDAFGYRDLAKHLHVSNTSI